MVANASMLLRATADIAPGYKIAASQLFDRYEKWCGQHGEQSLKVQDFKAKLQESPRCHPYPG